MEHADIRHVAVIGTGTIGASWAAYFMSRGLSVAASDQAPQAEATLRRFVAASWPALVQLGAPQPLPDKVPEDRLSFHAESEAALAGVDFDAIAGGDCGGCRALDRRGGGGARSPAGSLQRSTVEILLEALASKLPSVQARTLVAH